MLNKSKNLPTLQYLRLAESLLNGCATLRRYSVITSDEDLVRWTYYSFDGKYYPIIKPKARYLKRKMKKYFDCKVLKIPKVKLNRSFLVFIYQIYFDWLQSETFKHLFRRRVLLKKQFKLFKTKNIKLAYNGDFFLPSIKKRKKKKVKKVNLFFCLKTPSFINFL